MMGLVLKGSIICPFCPPFLRRNFHNRLYHKEIDNVHLKVVDMLSSKEQADA